VWLNLELTIYYYLNLKELNVNVRVQNILLLLLIFFLSPEKYIGRGKGKTQNYKAERARQLQGIRPKSIIMRSSPLSHTKTKNKKTKKKKKKKRRRKEKKRKKRERAALMSPITEAICQYEIRDDSTMITRVCLV
jgi:hypothetical protein